MTIRLQFPDVREDVTAKPQRGKTMSKQAKP